MCSEYESDPAEPPDYVEFRRRAFSNDIVDWATIPIALTMPDATLLDRTGVLIAIGDFRFLITAEHFLEDYADRGYRLFLMPPRPDGPKVELSFERFYVSHDPAIDIAVFRLSDQQEAQLRDDYRFLRLNNVRLVAPRPDEGPFFLVTGFPAECAGRDPADPGRADVHRYLSSRYDGDYDWIENFNPNNNIVLMYDRRSRHTTGHVGKPPDAPGMSGCGIWYLPVPYGFEGWRDDDIRLVGIQHSWTPRPGYLKGTVISHALSMIWHWFADTRDPMRLHNISF